MGYSVALLGEKDGFNKVISFATNLDDKALSDAYDAFGKTCTGVRRDHLPLRCPIRRSADSGNLELQFDDRNLTYNFDSLMVFIAQIISSGHVMAGKILDGGRISGTAYVTTPGLAKKFEFYPKQDTLGKIASGALTFADILTSDDGKTLAAYLKEL